jgi:hypothetical protein
MMENRLTSPECYLPAHLLQRASWRGGEWAWRIADIPLIIWAARALNMVSLGGQLQFRFPGATCEVCSVEVQPFSQMAGGLSWTEQVAESAKVALRQFADLLSRYDFLQEGRLMFPVWFKREEQQGRDPRDGMWFVWYLNEPEAAEDEGVLVEPPPSSARMKLIRIDAMTFFREQLMSYFSDESDYEKAVAEMRAELLIHAEYAELIRTALYRILTDDQFDCLEVVQWCANRNVDESPAKARDWLERLQRDLFRSAT